MTLETGDWRDNLDARHTPPLSYFLHEPLLQLDRLTKAAWGENPIAPDYPAWYYFTGQIQMLLEMEARTEGWKDRDDYVAALTDITYHVGKIGSRIPPYANKHEEGGLQMRARFADMTARLLTPLPGYPHINHALAAGVMALWQKSAQDTIKAVLIASRTNTRHTLQTALRNGLEQRTVSTEALADAALVACLSGWITKNYDVDIFQNPIANISLECLREDARRNASFDLQVIEEALVKLSSPLTPDFIQGKNR